MMVRLIRRVKGDAEIFFLFFQIYRPISHERLTNPPIFHLTGNNRSIRSIKRISGTEFRMDAEHGGEVTTSSPLNDDVRRRKDFYMRITCLGASRCVTGSCFLLENDRKYLIDCGLFQGGKHMEAMNQHEWGFDPREISALFLTHAHVDHCGRIPKLVKNGFRGRIYTTLPTAELCRILLFDSAHIQEMEAEWQTRKNRREGKPDVTPLYTVDDVKACLPLFEVVSTDETISLQPDLRICFRHAGHILGSSILEVWCGDAQGSSKVVFSGDLGHKGQLIVRAPYAVTGADILFVESTYGNRVHKSIEESRSELFEAIRYSYNHKEKVIIPAFAVERTQEILFVLSQAFRDGVIPSMPVYLDSPLAIAATDIFRRMTEYYNESTLALIRDGLDPFDFPELTFTRSSEESMAINRNSGPAIVIAGNGMCTAGRIKHHLKHNLWRAGSSVVIVGFQGEGSLGRRIIEGAKLLTILGERVVVRAKVFTIGGFSAHADQTDLLEWLGHFTNGFMQVHVIHGERSASEDFALLVREKFGFPTDVPAIGDTISLAAPATVRLERPEAAEPTWDQRLARIIDKAAEIQALYESNRSLLPAQIPDDLERDLRRAEERLDALLKHAPPA